MAKKETVLTFIFENPNSSKTIQQMLKKILLEKLLCKTKK